MYLNVSYDKTKKMGIMESDYTDSIREHFSIKDSGASIKKMYNRHIPSRKYAITKSGRFDVGLFGEIYQYLKSLSIPIVCNVSNDFKEHFKPTYLIETTRLSALKLDLRDYQTESIQKCLKQGNGTLVLGTGAGKTLLMGGLIQTLHDQIRNHFTVIVVPSVQLVEQTFKDFTSYGIDPELIGRVHGNSEIEMGKPILIMGSQYLLVSKNIPDLIFDADLLVIDEVHGLRRDNQLNKLVKKFNTPHKFGFTGTLPESDLDKWNIIGKIGPLIYEKPSHELRKEGYLANVDVQVLRLHYNMEPEYIIPTLADPLAAYNCEREWVNIHPWRNNIIAELAGRTPQNTLIVVERISHGEILKQQIKSIAPNKHVYFIQGEVDIIDRERIRSLMEVENNLVVIAISKIFATGINIKNLHYIILAVSGKAKVRLIQSIGRGLRLHQEKEQLIILDVSDQLKYGKEHEAKRLLLYDGEQIRYVIKDIYEKKKD